LRETGFGRSVRHIRATHPDIASKEYREFVNAGNSISSTNSEMIRIRSSCLQSAGRTAAVLFLLSALPPVWAQGSPPSGGGTTTSVTYYATYTLNGGTAAQSNQTYTATAQDTSGVWVENSGALTLTDPAIVTSGDTSSQDNSSFYGLNAGLLVTSGSATVTGGSIATSGSGANGAFATGSAATVNLTNVTIKATGDGGHAVMATQGGTMTIANATMSTAGGSGSAVATDRGGGTVNVTGSTITSSGSNSAGIYSTGAISATNSTFTANGAESAVIEGSNSITLTDCTLTTNYQKWGVMIYQSMSGDASGDKGVFTMTGGAIDYKPASGPVFYVNNGTANITLKRVTVTAGSGVLVSAAAGSWGTSGSNGGTVILTANGQTLTGNMTADSISSIALSLTNSSVLTGTLTNASVTLDASSTWTVTGNSVLTSLTDSAGISGTSVTNIKGNGYTVTYNSSLSANSYLGGKTYTLSGGGSLSPAGTTTTSTAPAVTQGGVVNAASDAAGVAPAAWVSIYGTNLSTAAVAATASNLVSGYLPVTLGGTSVTIDGKSAFMDYVSPTQINVQAPADSATGTVTVTVTNSSGSSSVTTTMQSVLPGLFTASNYVLAIRWSDGALINGTGATAAGYTTAAAAKPGDILEIYATGLGATTPSVDPGLVFSSSSGTYYSSLTNPTVAIGGAAASVLWSGMIGPGLFQINLTVPASLAAGTYPVVVSQSGVSSPSTAVMNITAN
jgi:uncharacterized protein (TIGR03437 family)